jgi:hypothetical protein
LHSLATPAEVLVRKSPHMALLLKPRAKSGSQNWKKIGNSPIKKSRNKARRKWAQVNGWRGNTSIEKRIEYDLYYVRHWTLTFDLLIIVLTLLRGFADKNSY